MAYDDKLGYKLARRPIFENGVSAETITADFAMTGRSEIFQILTNNKGSSAIVSLPAEEDGLYVWIKCHGDSGHQIEVRNDAGATITYLLVGESGLFVCASAWHLVVKA